METSALNVLVLITFGLLIAVTGGVVYLTAAEWRDRRRQDREKRENRIQGKSKRKK